MNNEEFGGIFENRHNGEQERLFYVTFPTSQRAGGKEPACQCRRHRRCQYYPWVGEILWRRKWQPIAVFLPGEPHGQRSLVAYSP